MIQTLYFNAQENSTIVQCIGRAKCGTRLLEVAQFLTGFFLRLTVFAHM